MLCEGISGLPLSKSVQLCVPGFQDEQSYPTGLHFSTLQPVNCGPSCPNPGVLGDGTQGTRQEVTLVWKHGDLTPGSRWSQSPL